MQRWGWFLTASLLLGVSAGAQQGPAISAQPAAVQPVSATPGIAVAPQSVPRTPVSIDQVVDQIIARARTDDVPKESHSAG